MSPPTWKKNEYYAGKALKPIGMKHQDDYSSTKKQPLGHRNIHNSKLN
jgi:hypothetical protein